MGKNKSNNQIFSGIIHVTGEHDTGKTTFALECGAAPEKICFFDDDVKGRGTVEDLREAGVDLGAYYDLSELSSGNTELGFHNAVLDIVDKIKPGQFDAIVWDTWTGFEQTFHSKIMEDPSKYRKEWSPMGRIKSGQEWQEAHKLETSFLSSLAKKAKQVILITHLKNYYAGNAVVPGKHVPAHNKVLEKISKLRLWLRQHPEGSPVPMALVLKRLDKKRLGDEGIETVNVLPRRIQPKSDEKSLWASLRRYWNSPSQDRALTPDEKPSTEELSLIESTMTDDQMGLLRSLVDKGLAGGDEELEDGSGEKKTNGKDIVDNLIKDHFGGKKDVFLSSCNLKEQDYLDLCNNPARRKKMENYLKVKKEAMAQV